MSYYTYYILEKVAPPPAILGTLHSLYRLYALSLMASMGFYVLYGLPLCYLGALHGVTASVGALNDAQSPGQLSESFAENIEKLPVPRIACNSII